MKRNGTLVLGFVLAALVGTAPLDAAEVTTTLPVTANVVAACTVGATGVSFGTYTAGESSFANGTVTVNCASGTAYSVALNAGNNYTSGFRNMVSGSNGLSYYLFLEQSFTNQWGDSCGAASYPSGGCLATSGTGVDQVHTVYGVMPINAGSDVPGDYTDTVLVTVSF